MFAGISSEMKNAKRYSLEDKNMDIYNSKPHSIRAFRVTDMRINPPKWFMDAYHAGGVAVTNNSKDQYVVIYNKDGVRKAFVGDWVCMNSHGTIFPLSNDEFNNGFVADSVSQYVK